MDIFRCDTSEKENSQKRKKRSQICREAFFRSQVERQRPGAWDGSGGSPPCAGRVPTAEAVRPIHLSVDDPAGRGRRALRRLGMRVRTGDSPDTYLYRLCHDISLPTGPRLWGCVTLLLALLTPRREGKRAAYPCRGPVCSSFSTNRGSVRKKVEPRPSADSNQMCPWCCSTSSRQR
jgi:hypothetical protein